MHATTETALYQNLGFLVGSLMVTYEIMSGGERKASKFVMFITFFAQVSEKVSSLANQTKCTYTVVWSLMAIRGSVQFHQPFLG